MTDHVEAVTVGQGPERIYLAPTCCADPFEGRQWCEDDVWPLDGCDDHTPAIAYVRADLAQANEAMRSLDGAREAFLDLLADARDYRWEPDGDETGDHTTVHIISHWRQFGELALALGIPTPGYMQTWEDRIDAALSGDSA